MGIARLVFRLAVFLQFRHWRILRRLPDQGNEILFQHFNDLLLFDFEIEIQFQAMGEATFWFTLVLSIVILMIPVVAWRFYFVNFNPTFSDRIRLKQRLSAIRYVQNWWL